MNSTSETKLPTPVPLDLFRLADSTRFAAEAFIAAGIATNTVRSYRSALTYWAAWLQLRYSRAPGDGALPPEFAVQFIVDHLARPDGASGWSHLLPAGPGVKGKPGPLAFNTVSHRRAVLAKWHRLNAWDNPCEASAVKTLFREARKA